MRFPAFWVNDVARCPMLLTLHFVLAVSVQSGHAMPPRLPAHGLCRQEHQTAPSTTRPSASDSDSLATDGSSSRSMLSDCLAHACLDSAALARKPCCARVIRCA